jgi:acetyltransferase-like isoleucine patch superfamily enzyme
MSSVTDYFAEKNSASDEEILIHDIFFSSGQFVSAGEVVISAEGAKALFDIEMPRDGYIYFYVKPNSKLDIGDALFSVSDDPEGNPRIIESPKKSPEFRNDMGADSDRFTDAALELISQYGLEKEIFNDLSFVTTAEVTARMEPKEATLMRGRAISDFSSVALIGGGFGAEVILENLKTLGLFAHITGYFDSEFKKSLDLIRYFGNPTRDSIATGFHKKDFEAIIITVTSKMGFRKEISSIALDLNLPLATFIHPRAFIAESAIIAEGCIVLDSARVGHKAILKRNVFLSGMVNIDHHCIVGENSTFGPAVFFSGNVKSGAGCVYGSSIAVEPGLTIGSDCKIASGSVLTKSVPNGVVVKLKNSAFYRE